MKRVFCCLALVLLSAKAFAESPASFDWPQWQGPDRNAVSNERGLLKEWPKDGPPLAWKTKQVGGGYGAPSIAAGRIFGMGNRDEKEVVWALSEVDGKELWATPLGPAFREGPSQGIEGPGCTPTVDGQRLYVLGAGGDLACLQAEDGKIIWRVSLTRELGGRLPMWRYNESPLVDGDKVVCTPGGQDAMLVALDKLTGKTVWKSKMPSSPPAGRDNVAGTPSGPGRGPGAPGNTGRDPGAPGNTGRAPGGPSSPDGGSTAAVTGTKEPGLFTGEHYGMRAFSCKIPNGKYVAKLYFAETYAGITGPGQRVFSYTVQGREFKDFDIWVKAGGPRLAYIETVPVEVTNGEFRIAFTPQVENPAISAIEIVPQEKAVPGAATPPATIRIKAGRSTPFTDSIGQVWQPETGFEGGGLGGMFQMPGGFGGGSGGFAGGAGGRPGGFGGCRGGFGGGRWSGVRLGHRHRL